MGTGDTPAPDAIPPCDTETGLLIGRLIAELRTRLHAMRSALSHDDADDVLHKLMVRASRDHEWVRANLADSARRDGMLAMTVRRALLDWAEAQRSRAERERAYDAELKAMERGWMSPTARIETAEERSAVHRAIASLPRVCGEICRSLFVEGLSRGEAAAAHRTTVANVDKHALRGKALMRGWLEKHGYDRGRSARQ